MCNGILAAALFVPTQKEIDERKRNLEQADEIERIEKLGPAAGDECPEVQYAATPAGKIMVFHRGVNDKGKEFSLPVSTPFGVPARLRYPTMPTLTACAAMCRI